jgi:SAM-dependent methyltransferase
MKDPVAAYFDKHAETHKRQFVGSGSGASFYFQTRLKLACELAGTSTGRLLDCASGSGEITCALLKSGRFTHATIVDISPVMLQSAKELLTSQITNVELEFVHSDIFNFKPSDSRFDLVLCLGLIAHIGRLDVLLPYLKSMLSFCRQHLSSTLERESCGHSPRGASWRSADTAFPGFRNGTSPMHAMLPACGSWTCAGIAWAFRSETAFGRGQTFNWKPACKSGRAGMERMRFTCSHDKRNIGLCPVRPAELYPAAFRPAVFKKPAGRTD